MKVRRPVFPEEDPNDDAIGAAKLGHAVVSGRAAVRGPEGDARNLGMKGVWAEIDVARPGHSVGFRIDPYGSEVARVGPEGKDALAHQVREVNDSFDAVCKPKEEPVPRFRLCGNDFRHKILSRDLRSRLQYTLVELPWRGSFPQQGWSPLPRCGGTNFLPLWGRKAGDSG